MCIYIYIHLYNSKLPKVQRHSSAVPSHQVCGHRGLAQSLHLRRALAEVKRVKALQPFSMNEGSKRTKIPLVGLWIPK